MSTDHSVKQWSHWVMLLNILCSSQVRTSTQQIKSSFVSTIAQKTAWTYMHPKYCTIISPSTQCSILCCHNKSFSFNLQLWRAHPLINTSNSCYSFNLNRKLAMQWLILASKQITLYYLRLIISQGGSRFRKQSRQLNCFQQWFSQQINPYKMRQRKLFNFDCVLHTLESSDYYFPW